MRIDVSSGRFQYPIKIRLVARSNWNRNYLWQFVRVQALEFHYKSLYRRFRSLDHEQHLGTGLHLSFPLIDRGQPRDTVDTGRQALIHKSGGQVGRDSIVGAGTQ